MILRSIENVIPALRLNHHHEFSSRRIKLKRTNSEAIHVGTSHHVLVFMVTISATTAAVTRQLR